MPQLGFSSASLPEVAAHPTVRSDAHPTNRANVETRIEVVIGVPRGVTAQVAAR